MPEIRTVTTLVKKRDEIRASIRMYESKIAQARSDLSHVSAVLRLFEASGKAQDLAKYVDHYRLFKRGGREAALEGRRPGPCILRGSLCSHLRMTE
jgi:hypothetical protein